MHAWNIFKIVTQYAKSGSSWIIGINVKNCKYSWSIPGYVFLESLADKIY